MTTRAPAVLTKEKRALLFVCLFFCSNYSIKHQNKTNKKIRKQTNRNAGSCCLRGRPQGTAAAAGAGNSIVQPWRFSSADVSTYCLLLSCTLFLIYFWYGMSEDLQWLLKIKLASIKQPAIWGRSGSRFHPQFEPFRAEF